MTMSKLPFVPSRQSMIALNFVAEAAAPSAPHRAHIISHLMIAFKRQNQQEQDVKSQNTSLNLDSIQDVLKEYRSMGLRVLSIQSTARSEIEKSLLNAREALEKILPMVSCSQSQYENIPQIAIDFLNASDQKDEMKNLSRFSSVNPFLALALAREVLQDIDIDMRSRLNRGISEDIAHEPLDRIDRFYKKSIEDMPYKNPSGASMDGKIDKAVVILADLARQIERITRPFLSVTDDYHLPDEIISLVILNGYLMPYKRGLDKAITKSLILVERSADIHCIATWKVRQSRPTGIIPNHSAIIPEQPPQP